MVSIRRRRQLGYTTGVLSLDIQFDDEGVAYFITPPGTPEDQPVRAETRGSSTKPSSPKKLGSSSSANKGKQPKLEGSTSGVKKPDQSSPDGEANPRKKHKRNHTKEPEKLKGVYFKNQKWQAAIKVDKRQIHLGTFDSQAEAARVYDRAAFLCGRSPNFELPMEDVEELIKLTWDQFLIKTQDDIFYKSSRKRRTAARPPSKSNSPVIEPRAKRALSFSKGPEPEGPSSSRRKRTAARPPSKSTSPVIDRRGKRALSFSEGPEPEGPSSSRRRRTAARPPSKSISPVIDRRGKRALSFSEVPEPEGPSSSQRRRTGARSPSKSTSPVIDPRGKRALSFSEEPEGGWLWPLVPASANTSEI